MTVHLNLNRTRITICGFTLSLIVFALSLLVHQVRSAGSDEPSWELLPIFVPLFLGFVFALIALWVCMLSQGFSSEAISGLRTFVIADLAMWIALSQTASGILQIFVIGLTHRMDLVNETTAAAQVGIHAVEALLDWLFWIGGSAWLLVTYVAPAITILRSPIEAKPSLLVGMGYLLTLVMVLWISTYAYVARFAASGESSEFFYLFLKQFVQPVLWI